MNKLSYAENTDYSLFSQLPFSLKDLPPSTFIIKPTDYITWICCAMISLRT